MRKKLLALILSLMLMVSIVVPVSAAYEFNDGVLEAGTKAETMPELLLEYLSYDSSSSTYVAKTGEPEVSSLGDDGITHEEEKEFYIGIRAKNFDKFTALKRSSTSDTNGLYSMTIGFSFDGRYMRVEPEAYLPADGEWDEEWTVSTMVNNMKDRMNALSSSYFKGSNEGTSTSTDVYAISQDATGVILPSSGNMYNFKATIAFANKSRTYMQDISADEYLLLVKCIYIADAPDGTDVIDFQVEEDSANTTDLVLTFGKEGDTTLTYNSMTSHLENYLKLNSASVDAIIPAAAATHEVSISAAEADSTVVGTVAVTQGENAQTPTSGTTYTLTEGVEYTITPTATNANYEFDKWQYDGADAHSVTGMTTTVGDGGVLTLKLQDIADGTSIPAITAVFKKKTPTLTTGGANGSVAVYAGSAASGTNLNELGSNSITLTAGETYTLVAAPTDADNNRFTGWVADASLQTTDSAAVNGNTSNTISFVMPATATSVTAAFAAKSEASATVSGIDLTSNNAPATSPVNAGTELKLAVTVSGEQPSGAAVTYKWSKDGSDIPGATNAEYTVNSNASNSDSGTYKVTVTVTDATGNYKTKTYEKTFALSVLDPMEGAAVTIASDKADNKVNESEKITLTATPSITTPSGITPTYQWQKKGTGDADFANISGATAATYEITAAKADDGTQYQCVATFTATGYQKTVVTSAPLTIDVIPFIDGTISITKSYSETSVMEGTAVTLTATPADITTGATATYKWYSKTGAAEYTEIPDETNETLSLGAVTTAMSGTSYKVVATYTLADYQNTEKSAEMTLTVGEAPALGATISVDPALATIDKNTGTSFTISVTHPTLTIDPSEITYKWYKVGAEGTTLGTEATLSITDTNLSATGTYKCDVTISKSGYKVQAETKDVTVTVLDIFPDVITTQPEDTSATIGGTTSMSVAVTDPATTTPSYQWYKENGATDTPVGTNSATLDFANAAVADAGDYYCVITYTMNGYKTSTLTSDAATLTVKPYITATASVANKAALNASTATFEVTLSDMDPADATVAGYQWYNGADNSEITGATSATYTTGTLSTAGDNGKTFYCKVTLTHADCTDTVITSNTATLTVSDREVVVATPSGPEDVTANVGDDVSFEISLTGITDGADAPSYKWYRKGPADPDFTVMTDETAATLSLTDVTADMNGTKYKVEVTITKTDCDPYEYTSEEVTLTVKKVIEAELTGPADEIVDEGANTTFEVGLTVTDPDTTPDEVTYKWYKYVDGVNDTLLTDGDKYAGAATQNLTVKGAVLADAGEYYCVVTIRHDGYAAKILESDTAELTVNPQIHATVSDPANATVTEAVDSEATFTVAVSDITPGAADGTITYQWYKYVDGSSDEALTNGDDYAGVDTATLTVKTPTVADDNGAQFYCVVTIAKTDFATFEEATEKATLTVNAQPTVSATVTGPENQIKQPGQSATFTVNVTDITADADAPTYVWSKSTDGASWDPIADTDNSITIDNLTLGDNGTQYKVVVTITKTGYIDFVAEKTATLSVNDLPSATGTVTAGENVTVYEGEEATLSVTATPADGATATYQWYKDGEIIDGATEATYTIAAAATADTGSYVCKVTFSKDGHNPTTVDSDAIALTVNALGTLVAIFTEQPEDASILEGEDATFEVVPYVTPAEDVTITYKWFEELGETDELIEAATTAVLELTDVSGEKNGSKYYCVVTFEREGYADATLTSDLATLTVTRLMDVDVTDPEDAEAMVGEEATLSVTATAADPADAAITYQWYKEAGDTDTPIASSTGATLTFASAAAEDSGEYYCVVTFTKDGYKPETVTTEAAELTVYKLIEATLTNPENQNVSYGTDVYLTVTATATEPADATITYQWYKEAGDTDTAVEDATEATLVLSNVQTDQSGDTYYCVATFAKDGYKTKVITSEPAIVTVNGAVAGTVTNPESLTVRPGASATFTVTATATDPADATITYQWYKGEAVEGEAPVAIEGATEATYTIAEAAVADSGKYYCVVKFDAEGYEQTVKTTETATLVVRDTVLSKITSNESTNGSYTFTIGDESYDDGDVVSDVAQGTVVTINTKADKNYELSSILVAHPDDSDIAIEVDEYGEFTMPAHDVIISVRFKKTNNSNYSGGGGGVTSYKVTYDLDSKGTIAGGGKNTEVVNSGAKPKAVPAVAANEGYKFVGWTLDGEMVDPTTVVVKNAITFVAAYEDILIPAKYIKPYAKGYEDGSFQPDKEISRAELSAMIARIIYGDELPDGVYFSSFPDVERNAWYSKYIGFLEDKNVLTGYEDGTFRPLNSVTRGEFCTIIARAQKYDLISYAGEFGDVTENDWAKDYIATLADHNIVEGYEDGSFGPYLPLTRAEAVAIINRVLAPSTPIITFTPNDISGHWAEKDIMLAVNERNVLE